MISTVTVWLVGHDAHVKLFGLAFLLKLCFVFFSPLFTFLISTLFKIPILFNVFDYHNPKEKEQKKKETICTN